MTHSAEIKNNSGWRPQGQAILLRAFELAEKQSRIAIPEEVARSSATCDTMGVVVEIGPDCWKGENESPRAKVGDRVLFTKYSGGVITGTDGYVYRMITCSAIYATEDVR